MEDLPFLHIGDGREQGAILLIESLGPGINVVYEEDDEEIR